MTPAQLHSFSAPLHWDLVCFHLPPGRHAGPPRQQPGKKQGQGEVEGKHQSMWKGRRCEPFHLLKPTVLLIFPPEHVSNMLNNGRVATLGQHRFLLFNVNLEGKFPNPNCNHQAEGMHVFRHRNELKKNWFHGLTPKNNPKKPQIQ